MTKCQTVTICIITQNYNTPNFILNTKKRQQVKNTMQSRDCSRLIMVCLAVLHNLQLLSLYEALPDPGLDPGTPLGHGLAQWNKF